MAKVLAVPDLHLPFNHKKKTEALYSLVSEIKPDYIVQLGDLEDQYNQSKFPRSYNVATPKDERKSARDGAVYFWEQIKKRAPKAQCHQLLGNHDIRVIKRILEKAPEAEDYIDLQATFYFKGVKTHYDQLEPLIVQGVGYVHGWLSGMNRMQHANMLEMPIVHGHTHAASIFWTIKRGKSLWEMECGHLADESSKPLQYGNIKNPPNWQTGCGLIEDGIPKLIAL